MEIKIKVEGLDQFTEAMALMASALAYKNGMESTGDAAKDIVKDTQAAEDKPKVEKELKVTKTEDKVAETEEKVTIEEVRAKFMEKNSKQNTPKLKQILNDHGVKKVTDLKEDQFQSVLDALEAI